MIYSFVLSLPDPLQSSSRSQYMTGSNVAKLVYLTHGFMGDDETWAETTKDVLLKRYHNTNIVIGNVYWEHGARVGSRSMIKAMIEKPMICCHAEITRSMH